MCALAVGACGFGELAGLHGGKTQSRDDGGTDVDPTGMGGSGNETSAGSNGAGGSGDVSGAGGTAGGSAGGTGGGSPDAGDAPADAAQSCGRDASANDGAAGKILALTVYDTANAASWAVMTNFQIGPSAPDIWLDWPNSYVESIDVGAPALLGKDWIRTLSKSKLYVGTCPAAEAMITLNGTANVYLIIDDRATTSINPPMTGWVDTNSNMKIWETPTRSFPLSIWVKRNQTGDIYLPIQNYNDAYNYFVIVE